MNFIQYLHAAVLFYLKFAGGSLSREESNIYVRVSSPSTNVDRVRLFYYFFRSVRDYRPTPKVICVL